MEENDQLLKYIYHEDLYIISEPERTEIKEQVVKEDSIVDAVQLTMVEEERDVTHFGGNERKILIMVNDPDNELLGQKELIFLMSIVEKGLKFTKKDFALANSAVFSQEDILKKIPHNFLIAFGQKVDAFEINYSLYQIFERGNKKMLYAENLRAIAADKNKKGLLWMALKKMFDIPQK